MGNQAFNQGSSNPPTMDSFNLQDLLIPLTIISSTHLSSNLEKRSVPPKLILNFIKLTMQDQIPLIMIAKVLLVVGQMYQHSHFIHHKVLQIMVPLSIRNTMHNLALQIFHMARKNDLQKLMRSLDLFKLTKQDHILSFDCTGPNGCPGAGGFQFNTLNIRNQAASFNQQYNRGSSVTNIDYSDY